ARLNAGGPALGHAQVGVDRDGRRLGRRVVPRARIRRRRAYVRRVGHHARGRGRHVEHEAERRRGAAGQGGDVTGDGARAAGAGGIAGEAGTGGLIQGRERRVGGQPVGQRDGRGVGG